MVTNVATGLAVLWLSNRTRARGWLALTVGMAAAQGAAVVSVFALLLMLRINPIHYLLALELPPPAV